MSVKKRFFLSSIFLFFIFPLLSQELDPLLKLLVEKKVISYEEALSVQKEYDESKKENKKEIEKSIENVKKSYDAFKGLKIGGTYFISYQAGNKLDSNYELTSYSGFVLKRGYFDLRKDITPYLNVRFTPDITSDISGDTKLRLKFLYANFKLKDNTFFSQPEVKIGMVPYPWFGIEESIYRYRLQDPQFLDRLNIAQTADLGIMFSTNFGGLLDEEYRKNVSNEYAGKWGSFEIGIFNGGGYTQTEKNKNKVISARVSIRPLPTHLKGFQLHLLNITGKGNVKEDLLCQEKGLFYGKRIYPDFKVSAYMLSYQSEWFNSYFQYYRGKGNASGNSYYTPSLYKANLVDEDDILKATSHKGYSIFANINFGGKKEWGLLFRFDYHDPDTKGIYAINKIEDVKKREIFGISYKLYSNNMILLDYERLLHSLIVEEKGKLKDEERVQITLQIKF